MTSPIIIGGKIYHNISEEVLDQVSTKLAEASKQIAEFEDWFEKLNSNDQMNFKVLVQNPGLGNKLLSRMSEDGDKGMYARMLRFALEVAEAKQKGLK